MGKLVQNLQPLHDRLQQLNFKLGVPQSVNVVIYLPEAPEIQTLLFPNPKLESLTHRDVINFKVHQLQVNNSERWLKTISRVYDVDILGRCRYLVDPVVNPQTGLFEGSINEPLFVFRNGLMSYDVLIREFRQR